MTLISELIELPQAVRQGDFVLPLVDGVERRAETIRQYVVTPQLAECFDSALGVIRDSIQGSQSKANYLHGSFGSGKSHFMAILDLLLAHDSEARAIPELAAVIAKHNKWLNGKKFLLVPFHVVGAKNLEDKVLGGYVEFIARLHPDAPLPAIFAAKEIFENAEGLRKQFGDDNFFKALNKGNSAGGAWGKLSGGWTAASYAEALKAKPGDPAQERLLTDLIERVLPSAKGSGKYVDFDVGLAALSRHAKSLGYDALIFFLDELILWLAGHAANPSFIQAEVQKMVKLVESQSGARPVPIVSFIARQRDLRELVGANVRGNETLAFMDTLRHWEGRFYTIKLEDRNLPEIVEKRVLRTKNGAARIALEEEFEKTKTIRTGILEVLLTKDHNPEIFRKVYPFSPAFIEALVALSAMLQRERTAIKILFELLVEQRESLKLGDLIPLGDLFDLVAEGDEALSDEMKKHLLQAKQLYQGKLKPALERTNQITFEQAGIDPTDPRALSLRNQDRWVKTVLLAALAPEVSVFKELTAGRIAALNHGTIKSPIPGRESQVVLDAFRRWNREFGEIKISQGTADPTIAIQLVGVDTDEILNRAAQEFDSDSSRIILIKEILFTQFGIKDPDNAFVEHEFVWRATPRVADIRFVNVREASDETFKSRKNWKVIIDYPFDSPGHGPEQDLNRVVRFCQECGSEQHTIVWLPRFLTARAQAELKKLVTLRQLLRGTNFVNYTTHLSSVDRVSARQILDNQKSALDSQVLHMLEMAYGLSKPDEQLIDLTHEVEPEEQFQSLWSKLPTRVPSGGDFGRALENLLDQALSAQFPRHPRFADDARLGATVANQALAEIKEALQLPDGRRPVAKEQRKPLRLITEPLALCQWSEDSTHMMLKREWANHFDKKYAEARQNGSGTELTVAALRRFIDEPEAWGLPRLLEDLIILTFAAQTNRSFYLGGQPYPVSLEDLRDELTLREESLPSQSDWELALERVGYVFGEAPSRLLNAMNLQQLCSVVKQKASALKSDASGLVTALSDAAAKLDIEAADSKRTITARSAWQLFDVIERQHGQALISTIARTKLDTSAQAIGTSIKSARVVCDALPHVQWQLLHACRNASGARGAEGKKIWDKLCSAFKDDEYVTSLVAALKEAAQMATTLLVGLAGNGNAASGGAVSVEPTGVSIPPVHPGKALPRQGTREVGDRAALSEVFGELNSAMTTDAEKRLRISWEFVK
jgi:hypothetical protein